MVNRLSADVAGAAAFYERLLGLERLFTSDWFVVLGSEGVAGVELGLLDRDHETVPEAARGADSGTVLTFVVADCEAIHARARDMGAEIVQPPADTEYGQRRMLIRDPDGAIIDISAPTAPAPRRA
ncbi:VOC family protein [Jannaschia sp. KMU-145]|uniref:VOC family protein n=1 Tax=Jannaschia halovivens TaxID=3388667 RepID=UPI00396B0A74